MIEAFLNSPMFGLALTIGTYLIGKFIQNKIKHTLANPLVIGAAFTIAVLAVFKIPYENYAKGADVINWMLGPVTALLALGIYNQRKILKEYFIPVLVGCTAGACTSIFSILGLCKLFDVDKAITAAMMPKSCTTPIAVSIAEAHGGLAAIAATCVAIAGITGALCAPMFSKWFFIKDPMAQGLATGACSHALGTATAREMGELQGAMSSIAIGICGMISVVICLFITV